MFREMNVEHLVEDIKKDLGCSLNEIKDLTGLSIEFLIDNLREPIISAQKCPLLKKVITLSGVSYILSKTNRDSQYKFDIMNMCKILCPEGKEHSICDSIRDGIHSAEDLAQEIENYILKNK